MGHKLEVEIKLWLGGLPAEQLHPGAHPQNWSCSGSISRSAAARRSIQRTTAFWEVPASPGKHWKNRGGPQESQQDHCSPGKRVQNSSHSKSTEVIPDLEA